ncbi:hypothetical protein ABEY65_26610 [Priestia aryabhattai]|uniref:hypothetical protein n=1 Tax=Priestia aryabhattai TaxID=412384 RepID=UPI003D2DDE46
MKALKEDGVTKIFKEKISGTSKKKELNNLLEVIKSGDTLVVTKQIELHIFYRNPKK